MTKRRHETAVLRSAAFTEDRGAISRDIHDGILQSLTALAMQLKSLESNVASRERQRLAEIRRSLSDQQGRLRQLLFFAESRKRDDTCSEGATAMISKILSEMKRQWNCTSSLSVHPKTLTIARSVAENLSHFIAEAIANGVGHGGASHFEVEVTEADKGFSIRLRDNGGGIEGLNGSFTHDEILEQGIGSRSLRDRARKLGASMSLRSSDEGLEIALEAAPN